MYTGVVRGQRPGMSARGVWPVEKVAGDRARSHGDVALRGAFRRSRREKEGC